MRGAVSYAIRIQWLNEQRDEWTTRLAHEEPGGRRAREIQRRIDGMKGAIVSLERLIHQAIHKARAAAVAAEPARIVTPVTPTPLPAAPVSTPRRLDFSGSSAPMPSDALFYKPARESDLELVLVWTPHRDAPSLIGAYSSRPRA